MSLQLHDHAPALIGPAAYLARVVSVKDPDSLNRVQVRIYNCDSFDNADAPVWARVAVPFAGSNKGAFLFPDVDDEVLVVFVSGDPRFPIVVGAMWNGKDQAPDQFGGSGDSVDRWTFTGRKGTKISIVEESGHERIRLQTPAGQSVEITDNNGGQIELTQSGGNSIKLEPQGITIKASGKVTITAASQVQVNASQVKVTAALSDFSGIVKCDVLQATSVIGTSYTPGAGNIW